MDHGHDGHDMGPKCSTHMLWNTQIIDTCIVFRQWHIASRTLFLVSFLAIVALGVSYEYLRAFQKSLDLRIAESLSSSASSGSRARSHSPARLGLGRHGPGGSDGSGRSSPDGGREDDGLLSATPRRMAMVRRRRNAGNRIPFMYRTTRAVLYAATVFLSFFLMLVFMTYNAYLILAVVTGAAIGHYIFGGHMDVDAVLAASGGGKGMACH